MINEGLYLSEKFGELLKDIVGSVIDINQTRASVTCYFLNSKTKSEVPFQTSINIDEVLIMNHRPADLTTYLHQGDKIKFDMKFMGYSDDRNHEVWEITSVREIRRNDCHSRIASILKEATPNENIDSSNDSNKTSVSIDSTRGDNQNFPSCFVCDEKYVPRSAVSQRKARKLAIKHRRQVQGKLLRILQKILH